MPYSRVFVSYACVGDERGAEIAKQLVREIRAQQREAVTDHETISDEEYIKFINRELPQCGYLVFVQTPVSLQSPRVQAAVNMALALVASRRMQSVLRVIAAPSYGAGDQPPLVTLRTFDASMDYQRARDKLFIELGLISLDPSDSLAIPPHLLASIPRAPAGNNRPPQPSGSIGNARPPQPSGPMSGPISNNQPFQPAGPISGPIGHNQPFQPAGPMSRPPVPAGFPAGSTPQGYSQPASTFGKVWHRVSTLAGQPWNASQTRVAAQPDKPSLAETPTLLEDRPLPLHTTRQSIIRWAVIIGIAMVLALGIILTIALVKNHASPQKPQPPIHRLKSNAISTPGDKLWWDDPRARRVPPTNNQV